MSPALRHLLAAIAGLTAAFLLVSLLEGLGHLIKPPPGPINFKDPEAARAAMQKLTLADFAFVFLAHAAGAFGGSVVAGLISPGRPLLWTLAMGGLVFAASVAVLFLLHIPPLVATLDLGSVLLAMGAAYAFLQSRGT